MSVPVLLGHHWRRHRTAFVVLSGSMCLFEWLMTRFAPEASQTQAFQGLLQLIPAPFLDMLGGEFAANFNARGMIGFGYAHPFALMMMGVWAVRVSAGALAGEIGTGTMDLLAARPVRRSQMVQAALVALLAGLAVIVMCGWAGTAVGLATRPVLAIAPWAYLRIACGLWLLFAAFGAAGLAVSSLRRQGGAAIGVTTGLIVGSFALNFVAQAWAPIRWTHRFSLFMYYRPEQLYRSGVITTDSLVLAAIGVIASAGAFLIFRRRDL